MSLYDDLDIDQEKSKGGKDVVGKNSENLKNEPPHDITNKMTCAQQRLRSTWAFAQSDQSLRCVHKENHRSLATHWAHSEDSAQTGQMPRLIWVFAGHTSFCWLCHEAAQILTLEKIVVIILKFD